MKKITIFLFLIPFALYGQKTNVRTVVSGNHVTSYRGATLLNIYGAIMVGDTATMLSHYIERKDTSAMLDPYARVADSINFWEVLDTVNTTGTKYDLQTLYKDTTGIYNVLKYGVISDDGINDADDINEAITAAAAFSGGFFGDGTVYIPPGNYTLTDSIHLKSNVHIDIAKNAYFNIGTFDGSVFYAEDEIVKEAWVTGGVFYSGSRLYTGISLIQTTSILLSYTSFCHFKDITFYGCARGIYFYSDNNGWSNANTFSDISIRDYIIGIEAINAGGSIAGNAFNDIILQSSANSTNGLIFNGSSSNFNNLWIWDLPAGQQGASLAGSLNTFIGGYIPQDEFVDSSEYGNNIRTNNEWITRSVTGIEIKKHSISYPGHPTAEFTFTSAANEDRQNILIDSMPRNARILGIEIINRIPANYPGANPEMLWRVGTASAGEQYIVDVSCNTYMEAINIIDADKPLAMDIDYLNPVEIWIGVDIVTTLWNALTAGSWDIFISYIRYPFE